MTYKTLYFIV